ncbi:MAG: cation transporter [Minisyncoccia bacterium]
MSKDCCDIDELKLNNKENDKLKIVFWIVLIINLSMFLTEFISGTLSHSNALIADSLDMLADTFVYGISIYAITKKQTVKANVSLVKGVIMMLLGLYVVVEIIYKIINPIIPTAEVISIIGIIALLANAVSFLLLLKYRNGDINARSSWICSRNDIWANVAVIIAGLLVGYFNSIVPDILAGLGIVIVVLYSSFHIIKESLHYRSH